MRVKVLYCSYTRHYHWGKLVEEYKGLAYIFFVCFTTSCESEIIFKNLNKQRKIILQVFS